MNPPATAKSPDRVESGQKEKFPPQIAFIVGTEACERFSWYGMYGILNVYLSEKLLSGVKAEAHAKEIVHLLSMSIYFLPLVGGYLADRWWGRYKTILYLSLFYCLGHGTLAMYGDSLGGVYAGLAFIAIGAGGIKPNVSAFMGDQFGGRQGKWLTRAYGWFYCAVNFGSLFGFTVIPWLRDKHGYGWAFGVPGIFMGLATVVFWLGRNQYVHVPTAHESKQAGFLEILWHCVTAPGGGRQGFFDRARGRFTPEEIEGARTVFRIVVVFATLPIFWALYFQVNSSWVDQAKKMVPFQLFGLKPDFFNVNKETIQSAGALLVLIWVPIMTLWLYPLAEKLGLRPTPLRRISVGLVLTAASFVVCAVIQQHIDRGEVLSIGWQLVPYTILEAGEVLVSATALEFAFGQAPPSMKSTIMSFWFLTSSAGNLLVAAITALNENFVHAGGATEYVFYAALMLVGAVAFIIITRNYRYGSGPATPA